MTARPRRAPSDLSLAPFVQYDPATGDVVMHGLMPRDVLVAKVAAGDPIVIARGQFGRDRVNLTTKQVSPKERQATPDAAPATP